MKIRSCGGSLWALTLLLAGSAFGQGVTGTITGVVKDPSGAVVAGAKVAARSTSTGAEVKTTSDTGGVYRLANLVPGRFRLRQLR